jgi:hypothetical protein
MTDEAVFTSYADARAAADAAMPRRKRNRPYPQSSGWHWARSIRCPICDAPIDADCRPVEGERPITLHKMREETARNLGRAADRWIVCAYPNLVMLRDGSMFDHQRKVTVRP